VRVAFGSKSNFLEKSVIRRREEFDFLGGNTSALICFKER
jgi:hypothetical protein